MAEPTDPAQLATSGQITVEQKLDEVRVTIAAPSLRRMMLMRGILILLIVGNLLWALINWNSPTLSWAFLLFVLGTPLIVVLTWLLRPQLYEISISSNQLELQSGTLSSLKVPLDHILDCHATDGTLHLHYHTEHGGTQEKRLRVDPRRVSAEGIARLIQESIAYAHPSGSRAEIPDSLAAMRTERLKE